MNFVNNLLETAKRQTFNLKFNNNKNSVFKRNAKLNSDKSINKLDNVAASAYTFSGDLYYDFLKK